jgi:hypothetical protein
MAMTAEPDTEYTPEQQAILDMDNTCRRVEKRLNTLERKFRKLDTALKEAQLMEANEPYAGLMDYRRAVEILKPTGDIKIIQQDGREVVLYKGLSRSPDMIIAAARKVKL